MPPDSKVQQIKDYREKHGVGLIEARRVIEREDRLARLDTIAALVRSPWSHEHGRGLNLLVELIREIV